MLCTLTSLTLEGLDARPVRVEVDVHKGLPGFAIVGLPDAAVRESRERVRAALVNAGFEFPLRRIVVQLAPVSLRKAGPGLDLAIAVALLGASAQIETDRLGSLAVVGELGLDGSTRPVLGAVSIAEGAAAKGTEALLLPAENGEEAALVKGPRIVPLRHLRELTAILGGLLDPPRPKPLAIGAPSPHALDMAELRGAPQLRLALEVAAAGGHDLLMVGPAGSGKSLAAARLPSILPPLSSAEELEVLRIASATGRAALPMSAGRPFRAPHHTIGPIALLGGGVPPRLGEVTLAHRGVLYLDELSEFRRDSLEALGTALGSGEVSIARAGRRRTVPARLQLLAGTNPCPCGRGQADPGCSCAPHEVERYAGKLEGTLPGRFDLRVALRAPSAAELSGQPGEPSEEIRARVIAARAAQEERLGAGRANAQMSAEELRGCGLGRNAALLVSREPGPMVPAVRVARTLADLAGEAEVDGSHIAEALSLRRAQIR